MCVSDLQLAVVHYQRLANSISCPEKNGLQEAIYSHGYSSRPRPPQATEDARKAMRVTFSQNVARVRSRLKNRHSL